MLLDTLSSLTQRLVQGVRKALDAGVAAVHVVTDHGFLLLTDVPDGDKITPPVVQTLKLSQRYLLGRDLPEHSGLLRFPIRGSDDLWVYCPPGIAAFSTAGRYEYSHGGSMLQEVVLPHIIVRRAQTQRRVGVRLVAPADIHNAIFKIELQPEASSMFDLARDVRIAVERQDGIMLRDTEALVTSTDSVSINLRLAPADRVPPGSSVAIVVRDAQTSEELARVLAAVHIDLEL
jgi:hypothetical protein